MIPVRGKAVTTLGLWILASACVLALLMGCSSPAKPPASQERAAESIAESIPAGSTVVRGAGATFPSVLYKRWFTVYHEANPGTYVKYAAVGSGEGIRRFLGKDLAEGEAIDFGASDAAMTDAQIEEAGNNVLLIPATAGCVVLAYNIPGFRLLTIVLGFNPVNMSSTDRSAANILRALVELLPGGHLITQALDNHGVFNKAAAGQAAALAKSKTMPHLSLVGAGDHFWVLRDGKAVPVPAHFAPLSCDWWRHGLDEDAPTPDTKPA